LSNAFREHVRNANAQLFEDNENISSNNYTRKQSGEGEIGYTEFDFHSKVKLAGGIESVRDNIRRDPDTGGKIDQFGYCLAAISHTPSSTSKYNEKSEKMGNYGNEEHEEVFENLIAKQEGIFRVNCLDCLE
jgi:hypothetical protein